MNVRHNFLPFLRLLVVLGMLSPLAAWADSLLPDHPRYAITHFGDRFGLGSATVTALAQDYRGFLWIGTQSGIYRYDGANVRRYGPEEGLPGHHVDQILAGPDGSLWVRTTKGIAYLSRERFSPVALPEKFGRLRDGPQTIAIGRQGTLFVATEGGLVRLRRSGESQTALGEGQILSTATPGAIVRGPDDTIWFAAAGRIWKLSPGSAAPELFCDLPAALDPVLAIAVDGHAHLWVRARYHLAAVDLKDAASREPIFHDEGVPGANMYGAPSVDHEGNVLLPTSAGLFRWANDHWVVTDHRGGLTSSAVFSALEDSEGTIWVGLAGAGLDRWPGSKQWSGWTDSEGLPDSLVLRILRDARSRLWVGTNNGLAAWDPAARHWLTWNSANGLAGSGVTQLARTPDGAIWQLCYHSGVTRIDATGAKPILRRVPHSGEWPVVDLAAAADGSVWVSAEDGLSVVRYEKGEFHEQDIPVPTEAIGMIRALAFDAGGGLWAGGPGGLAYYAKGKWSTFHKSDGLLGDNVHHLLVAGANELWIGYQDEDAVTRARIQPDGRIVTNHVAKGVCVLGMDRSRNVWLGLESGAGELSASGTLRRFTRADGLLWDDVNCGAFWQEADGSVLIGSSQGLVRYDPAQEESALAAPPVVLTSAKFGNRELLNESRPRIPYQDRTFQAEFAAMTFRDSDRLRCRYRLRGLETEFTETRLREARYALLPAGEYTFEVRCGSDEHGWSSRAAMYPFVLEPPWWQRLEARLSGVLLALLAVWGFTQERTRRLRRERARLEEAVAAHSMQLARANAELQEASLTDPLTGVRNRRFFETVISADTEQALRAYRGGRGEGYSTDHRELVFFLVDLDYFKNVNDEHGHDAGDRVLVQIAQRLRQIVRQSDYLVRWGGEEFLIVCRAAERAEAHITATRILAIVSREPFELANGRRIHCSCSVGWAPFPWSLETPGALSLEETMKCADRGLYFAKDRGRARAVGVVPRDPAAVPLYKDAIVRHASFQVRGVLAMEICAETPSVEAQETQIPAGSTEIR